MKTSFWSLGLVALALPVTSCKRQESAPAPETPVAVTETPAAPAAKPSAPVATQTEARPSQAIGATIDLYKVMQEAKPSIEARKRIDAARAEVKTEVEERKKRIQTLAETVTTSTKRLQNPALTTPEREALVKDVNAKRSEATALEGELKEFVSRREKALAEKTKVEMGRVIQDIRLRTNALANADGYVWVMDRSGSTPNQVPAVVYVKPSLPDLTPAVIQAINAEAK